MKKIIFPFLAVFILSIIPVFDSNAAILKNSLVKFSNSPEIYLIKDGRMLYIKNQEMFSSLGYNWSDVKNLSKTEKGKYQRMKLVKTAESPTVYYLTESGMKRPFVSPEAFLSYDNKWSDIITISDAHLAFFSENNLIRKWEDEKVYKIENGKKRWIKTVEAFNSLGLDWSKIAPVSPTELEAYQDGEPIESGSATPTPTPTLTPTPSITPTPTSSPSLTLTKSSTPDSSSVFKGATNVEGLGISFSAGTEGKVTLTKLIVRVYADDAVSSPFDNSGYGSTAVNSIVSTLSLFNESGSTIKSLVSLSLVGTIGSSGGYYKAEFSDLNYDFPAGSQDKFIVKANLTDTFTGSKYIAFDILPSEDVVAKDSNGNNISFSNQNQNLNLASHPVPKISCFQSATVSVEVDSATPSEAIVLGGSSDVGFTKYRFSSDTEATIVKGLKLYNSYGLRVGDYDDNISSVILSYPKDANGTTEEKTGILTNGILAFSEGSIGIYIPKGGSSFLTIKASLNSTGGEADTGDRPKISLAKVSNQWGSGSTLTDDFIAEGVSSGEKFYGIDNAITVDNSNVKQMIIRRSKPILSSVALPSAVIADGTNILYKWKNTANADGSLGWKMIIFNFSGKLNSSSTLFTIGTDDSVTGQDGIYGIKDGESVADAKLISNLKIYNNLDSTQINGTFYYRSKTTTVDTGGYYAVFVAQEEQVINTEGVTYELRGDIASPIAGSIINVNIPYFSSATLTNSYDVVAGDNDSHAFGTGSSVVPTISYIWSDRSLATHSDISLDWANDYLISSIPTSVLQMIK